MPSFYIDFHERSTEVKVVGDEYHHIVKVFRHGIGDDILIVNGQGLLATGRVVSIDKKAVVLGLSGIKYVKRAEQRVACAFSLLKNKNDLLIVEKLTELGVNDLFPIQTINSVKLGRENTVDKMRKVAISAMKQCDNPWLPQIHEVMNLEKLLKTLKGLDYKPVVASELRPDMSMGTWVREHPVVNVCAIIGCEGGFEPREFEFMESNGVVAVKVSNNVLRAETAAICAVAQLTVGS